MRHTERGREVETRQREKQAPCREPDAGLDPGTPGSRPELKAGAQPRSHPVALMLFVVLSSGDQAWAGPTPDALVTVAAGLVSFSAAILCMIPLLNNN